MHNCHPVFNVGDTVWVVTADLHTDEENDFVTLKDYMTDFDIVQSRISHVYENDYEWTYTCENSPWYTLEHSQVFSSREAALDAIQQEISKRRTLLTKFFKALNDMQIKFDSLV